MKNREKKPHLNTSKKKSYRSSSSRKTNVSQPQDRQEKNDDELSELQKAAVERYVAFLEKVVETHEVWGLKNKQSGWVFAWTNLNGQDRQVLPFWSSKTGANRCVQDAWAKHKPTSIPLDEFINNWLPGMNMEGLMVGLNWNTKLIGYKCNPDDLIEDLHSHLDIL